MPAPASSSVSVVIPCYNVETCVADAVASALAQTHAPLEVICVDDGSTDGTTAVLAGLAAEHPEVVRVVEGAHRGAPAARNAGLAAAGGTFVQFLDADDLLSPPKLAHQVKLAEAQQADIVAASYWRHLIGKDPWLRPVEPGEVWLSLIKGRLGITSANLWRRAAVNAAGGWNEAWKSSQEYEMMFRMLKGGARLAFDEEPLTTLREWPGSVSSWHKPDVRERHVRLRVEVLEYLLAHEGVSESLRREALDAVFFRLRRLYSLSPEAARRFHRQVIPRGYVPPRELYSSPAYGLAYRLFGFHAVEQLRARLRRPPIVVLKEQSEAEPSPPPPEAHPLVSVVIPCYNVETCVADAVASALAQTHAPLEVICVDDGSTDGTTAVLAGLAAEHPEVVRVVEGAHRGAPAARNAGLAAAGGTFVQFLDADDVILPEKIERQVALAQGARADIVAGAFLRCYDDGREVLREVGEDPWVSLVWSQLGVTSANLFRRSAVEAVGGWREGQHSSQEYELMFRMMKDGSRVIFDRTVHMRKGIRDDSISGPYDAPVRESYLALCTDVLEHLRAEGSLTPEQEQRVLDSIFVKVRNLYPLDAEAALRHHRRAVPWRYLPGDGTGTGLPFTLTYKLFGLRAAERLRTLAP